MERKVPFEIEAALLGAGGALFGAFVTNFMSQLREENAEEIKQKRAAYVLVLTTFNSIRTANKELDGHWSIINKIRDEHRKLENLRNLIQATISKDLDNPPLRFPPGFGLQPKSIEELQAELQAVQRHLAENQRALDDMESKRLNAETKRVAAFGEMEVAVAQTRIVCSDAGFQAADALYSAMHDYESDHYTEDDLEEIERWQQQQRNDCLLKFIAAAKSDLDSSRSLAFRASNSFRRSINEADEFLKENSL